MDIIKELHEYFQPTRLPKAEGYLEKRQQLQVMRDEVVNAFGPDFWDQLTQVRGELDGDWQLEQFRTGFLLGASIMAEVFKSA